MKRKTDSIPETIRRYQERFSPALKDRIKNRKQNSKNTEPFVSVITVVFNGEKTLQKTIDSVKSQSYKNIEYIIVDGGSTDGTLEILENNTETISLWISEKDAGIYDAMNKGISIAKGELIGIINADDFYHSWTVEEVVKRYLETNGEILHGNADYLLNDEVLFTFQPALNLTIRSFTEMPLIHASTFITRRIYEETGLYDTSYKIAADWDLVLRAFLKKKKFVYIPKTLASFSVGGISTVQAEKGTKEIFSTLKRLKLIKRPLLDFFYFTELLKRSIKKYDNDNNVLVKKLFSKLRKFKKRVKV